MPVIAISVKRLNKLLKKNFKRDILVDSLEQLGCDVEDTVELTLFLCPACQTPNEKLEKEEPSRRCEFCGYESEESFKIIGTDRAIRLDLLADRPDLFDSGGLSRALNGYLGLKEGLSEFKVIEGLIKIKVDPLLNNRDSYRPFIVCAVVRIPALDSNTLREIMKLQESLHWGIGRDRKLASIGIYDMSHLTPPFKYTVVDPDHFKFSPLGMPNKELTPREIVTDHPKGKAYAELLKNHKKYPILVDSKGDVLSMPPIINSDKTKCKIGTTDLFIDITGISMDAVVNSLTTLCSALIELGGEVETVQIQYRDKTVITPDLSPKTINIKYEEAKRWLGLDFTRDEFMGYLRKMRLNVIPKGDGYMVSYPAFRTDIKHQVDLFEDLAIGYGYKNIKPKIIPSFTIPKARPEEIVSNIVREIMVGLGFLEIMSLHLQSENRHFTNFLKEPDLNHVIVKNPKTIEQKILRTHLKTGIMETFKKNKRMVVPQKIFEIGNILILDKEAETGVAEYRHLAFGIIGPKTGYAKVRMILDAVLRELTINGEYQIDQDSSFIAGRFARVNKGGEWIAELGEVHPQVINNFSLQYPVSYCELRLAKVV